MITFFDRKNIYLKILSSIIILFVADNLLLLVFGKYAEGRVIAIVQTAGGFKSVSVMYPVVEFDAVGKAVRFRGNQDTPYHEGDIVKVIYRPWMPSQARIYTISGMVRRPIIQFIICVTVWTLLYSSFRQANQGRVSAKRRMAKLEVPKFPEAEGG
jgi:hypothetical protein